MNTLVFNFISGFLSLLGAEPIEGGSEVRNYGLHTVWIVAGVLPPVNKNLSKKSIERFLEIYCKLCKLSIVVDVAPYKVTIYKHGTERHVYVSVYD